MTLPPGAKPCGAAAAGCPARDGKCVLPELASSGKARLAVVGEAPGRNEIEQGRPFIGASGKMLMRGLRTVGVSRGDTHWTNAVLCECPPDLQAKAAKACGPRLRAELKAAAPPVVMPVGPWGLQGTLGATKKPQILKWRGSVTPMADGPLVCPTVHPAFVMRAPKWGPILEIDVARVGRVMRDGFTAPELQPGRRIIVAKTRESVREAFGLFAKKAELAFDVETVGLGPTSTMLVCFALSDGDLTVVLPWSRGRDGREPFWSMPDDVMGDVNSLIARRVVVTHNGPAFDHIVAQRYGMRIVAWEDTLLGTHALYSHLPKGLSHVVTRYLDVTPWKEQEDRTADIDRLHIYNARDTLYTALARRAQLAELKEAS